MIVYIAKNQTGSSISLDDLAMLVPGNGQIDLRDGAFEFEIINSQKLKTEIIAGNIILNDGTVDLTQSESLNAVTISTALRAEGLSNEDEISSSTTAQDWITKVSLTLPTSGSSEKVVIHWYSEIFPAGKQIDWRLLNTFDSSIIGSGGIWPRRKDSNWKSLVGFGFVVLNTATQLIELQYKIKANSTAQMRKARLFFLRSKV